VIHAAITGWGKCLPPAVLSNHDLSSLLEPATNGSSVAPDSRAANLPRRPGELAYVAAARAVAAQASPAAASSSSCSHLSHEDQCRTWPQDPGARRRAACGGLDINPPAQFSLRPVAATALIRTQVVRKRPGDRAELISPFMDWSDRMSRAVRDGAAAVVLEASDRERACSPKSSLRWRRARDPARAGHGGRYANRGVLYGITAAVRRPGNLQARREGMSGACEDTLRRLKVKPQDVDLWCRTRRICASSKPSPSARHVPMERVYVNIQRYGNMSAATVPVALCEALERAARAPGSALADARFRRGLELLAPMSCAGAAARRP